MVTHSSILAWRIPMDRGAWHATVHRVAKRQTWLKWLSTHAQATLLGGMPYCKKSTEYIVRKTCLPPCSITNQPGHLRPVALLFWAPKSLIVKLRLRNLIGVAQRCKWDINLDAFYSWYIVLRGFPGGSGGKESACNAVDLGSIPGSGRSPSEGNGYWLFQYSCLDNPLDRGAWWAPVTHGVAKNRTQLSN